MTQRPQGLTTTQWLICAIAAMGFALDVYELLTDLLGRRRVLTFRFQIPG